MLAGQVLQISRNTSMTYSPTNTTTTNTNWHHTNTLHQQTIIHMFLMVRSLPLSTTAQTTIHALARILT